ncbi:hypothetical protein [Paenibacillus phocaensis]|uniref:hypothetical protein n=1 Tax=Paenibacillus phocaensis TaxID=1776378 RepID=UPI0003A69F03|nr:hypothetical protein [Paenibacillus phocaensis]
MLGIAGILAIAGSIAWIELPSMLKRKQYKELWVFAILLLLAVLASLPPVFSPHVPSPLLAITFVFKPFSELLSAIGLIPS